MKSVARRQSGVAGRVPDATDHRLRVWCRPDEVFMVKKRGGHCPILMVCLNWFERRSKIRISSVVVTTAYQSVPCVKAEAWAPFGKEISVGRARGVRAAPRRVTNRPMITRRPKIITAVSTVTKRRKNLMFAGST